MKSSLALSFSVLALAMFSNVAQAQLASDSTPFCSLQAHTIFRITNGFSLPAPDRRVYPVARESAPYYSVFFQNGRAFAESGRVNQVPGLDWNQPFCFVSVPESTGASTLEGDMAVGEDGADYDSFAITGRCAGGAIAFEGYDTGVGPADISCYPGAANRGKDGFIFTVGTLRQVFRGRLQVVLPALAAPETTPSDGETAAPPARETAAADIAR